ncbi:MAG TPA: malate dehydrogenase, partial [Prevotella sp.]|nr:malate dehydrogenase [Prevotella sp.]
MNYLTNDKLVIVGAGGMIGSNMVQSVLMLGLTPNVCLYDIYEPGVHGVFDEIQQCAFPGANVTYYAPAVEDMGNPEKVAEAAKKAFTGAKYIISSGGAPRKAGMTREDLLKGNCKIAADFGDN